MPAKYYGKPKSQTPQQAAAAALAKPTAIGQLGGYYSGKSGPEIRDIAFQQVSGKTQTIVNNPTFVIPQSPAFAGKASSKTTQDQAAAVEAEAASRVTQTSQKKSSPAESVSPIFSGNAMIREATASESQALSLAKAKGILGSGLKGLWEGFTFDFGASPDELASMSKSELQTFQIAHNVGFVGSIATLWRGLFTKAAPEAVALARGARAAEAALPVAERLAPEASAAARVTGDNILSKALGFTAKNAGNIVKTGAVIGGLGLVKKTFDFAESKIPPPSQTNIIQDATNLGDKAGSAAGAAINAATSAAASAVKAATSAATGAVSQSIDAVKTAAGNALQGATSGAAGAVTDAVKSVLGSVSGGVSEALSGGSLGELVENVKDNTLTWVLIGGAAIAAYAVVKE